MADEYLRLILLIFGSYIVGSFPTSIIVGRFAKGIDIRDHGPGVAMSIADQLGDTFVSTKSKGMGIGLFLTHATINRFGGGVSLYNHPEGGTLTEVTLPRCSAPT